MKSWLLLLAASVSMPAWGLHSYKCYSVDDNEPYGLEFVSLQVRSTRAIQIGLDVKRLVTETYKWDSRYTGGENMRNFLKFNVSDPAYNAYSEGPVTPFYVESELLTGGKPLRRGGMGGLIKTAGHGYSWANYLCVLQ
jgi:hypothetical protein